DRGGHWRRPDLERTAAPARPLDRELLLLPNRSGHAQFVAASDSTGRSRLEKTATRGDRINCNKREDGGAAAPRHAAGGTAQRTDQSARRSPASTNLAPVIPQRRDSSGPGETATV